MFERLKANILFHKLLKRPNINKAYAMVGPEDSWYDTIRTVHDSLAQIRQLPHQQLQLRSHDGLLLEGVYYPCQGSKATVICVHGYTSHAEREWAFPGLFYHSLGYNVLIPYQRAHGPSQGQYISFGALEHRDMMGWVDLVNQQIPDGNIVIHGLSMGGGIVLYLADKPLQNVKCLIADAPSDSIAEFLPSFCRHVYKDKAGRICPHLLDRFRKEFGVDVAQFNSLKILKDSKYPLLLAAGSNEHCEELFEKLSRTNPMPTESVILPGCNHGNGMYKQTDLFQRTIREFIEKYIERKQRGHKYGF